jgi:hypothetical protein
MGENRNSYRLFVGKPEEKRPLRRPRPKWVDNIKMDLVEVGWGDMDWIGLDEDGDRMSALANSDSTFGFHKMLGNYRVASQLVTSRVVLSSMELISERVGCVPELIKLGIPYHRQITSICSILYELEIAN